MCVCVMSKQASVVTAVGPVSAWRGGGALLQPPPAPVAILRRSSVNDGR